MLTLQQVARALGGEVRGNEVAAPGPGHSPKDRTLTVKLDANAPDGFIVYTFAPHDDPIACKDYVRAKLGLSAFKPNGGRRRRASATEISAMLTAAVQSIENEPPKGNIVAMTKANCSTRSAGSSRKVFVSAGPMAKAAGCGA